MYIFQGLLIIAWLSSRCVEYISAVHSERAGFRVDWVDVDVLGGGEIR